MTTECQSYIYYNPGLELVDLGALEEVGSNFDFYEASEVESLVMDALVEVGGSMNIGNNASLETFSASSLESLGGTLYIQDNSKLNSVDLSSLFCVDDYTIEGNALTEEDQYDLLVALTSEC